MKALDWDNLEESAKEYFKKWIGDKTETGTGLTTAAAIVTHIVKKIKCSILENVPGLFNNESENESVTRDLLKRNGVYLFYPLLDVKDCGIPAHRNRGFPVLLTPRNKPGELYDHFQGKYEAELRDTLNQLKYTCIDGTSFFDDLDMEFADEPERRVNKMRVDSGKKHGKPAKWVKIMTKKFEAIKKEFIMPRPLEEIPWEEAVKDYEKYKLGACAQTIVNYVDETEGRQVFGEQFIDVNEGAKRYVISNRVSNTLTRKSKIFRRSTRTMLRTHHKFAMQGYNIKKFPHMQKVGVTKADALMGDAVCVAAIQTIFLAVYLTVFVVPSAEEVAEEASSIPEDAVSQNEADLSESAEEDESACEESGESEMED